MYVRAYFTAYQLKLRIGSASLEEIRKPIEREIERFEDTFRDSMQSNTPLLDQITHYIYKRKGKQIRPLFVFFSADICGGINESTHRGAALVELLHTATLVHDDVVDNSYERRGFFSINALWKNKIAVLVGDFLLAKGLLLSLNNGDFTLLKIVSEAVKSMSEGELLQMEKARRMDIDENIYYDVIRQKTASLVASCCACGAASAGADLKQIELFREFGENVGMAFQIKDDLFDFGDDNVGKPRGIDIKEKKLTLPLIYALSQSEKGERSRIINLIKNHSEEKERVAEVITYVKEKGGMQYARARMDDFQQKAFDLLDTLPLSPSRQSLENLVKFTTARRS